MNEQTKKILSMAAAMLILVVGGVWLLTGSIEHIEDTNGADNYELAVITDEDIIKQEMGSLNVKKSKGLLNDGITFSSDKFSGVYVIFRTTYIFSSDFDMDLSGFYVNGGNFKMAVVNNGEIAAVVEPGMFAQCRLEGLKGDTALVIAGESADFEFSMDRLFCEQYDITME